jgi:hypothetical protein
MDRNCAGDSRMLFNSEKLDITGINLHSIILCVYSVFYIGILASWWIVLKLIDNSLGLSELILLRLGKFHSSGV